MIGKVIYENINGHTLIDSNGRLFIAPYVGIQKGEEMAIDERVVIEVPSVLFGLSVMAEKDVRRVVKFIREKW